MSLTRIERADLLPDQVADRLRDAITRGELRPGEWLRESAIAEQLGVSTIPVREAFRQLETEGLLSSEPRRGTFVRGPSAREIADMFRARASLEALCYEMIVERGGATPQTLILLQRLFDQERQALARKDWAAGAEADLAFHDVVLQETGSDLLQEIWQVLRARFKVFLYAWYSTNTDNARERAGLDHLEILEALRSRDLEALLAQADVTKQRAFRMATDLRRKSEARSAENVSQASELDSRVDP